MRPGFHEQYEKQVERYRGRNMMVSYNPILEIFNFTPHLVWLISKKI